MTRLTIVATAGLLVLGVVSGLLMLLYIGPEMQLLWMTGLFGCG